jgi:hypothetical protein
MLLQTLGSLRQKRRKIKVIMQFAHQKHIRRKSHNKKCSHAMSTWYQTGPPVWSNTGATFDKEQSNNFSKSVQCGRKTTNKEQASSRKTKGTA